MSNEIVLRLIPGNACFSKELGDRPPSSLEAITDYINKLEGVDSLPEEVDHHWVLRLVRNKDTKKIEVTTIHFLPT